MRKRRTRLKSALSRVKSLYDVALLDCPPNISLLSENVFRLSDAILVPIVPSIADSLGNTVASPTDGPPAGGGDAAGERLDLLGQPTGRAVEEGDRRILPTGRDFEPVAEDPDAIRVGPPRKPRTMLQLRPQSGTGTGAAGPGTTAGRAARASAHPGHLAP